MIKRFFWLTIIWLAVAAGAQAAPWPAQCIQPIAFGQTITGSLDTTDCLLVLNSNSYYTDVYTFSGVAGQQIAITMSSSAIDSYLELHPANEMDEFPLEDDDDGGGDLDARIPAESGYYILPVTGTYYIWANSSPPLQTGAYTITLTELPPTNPWPANCIQPIEIGQTISGTLTTSDCSISYDGPEKYYTDIYSFRGTAGQRIAVAMDSTVVDSWVELHNVNSADATPLYTGDDEVGLNARIPNVSGYFTLPATGTYYIWTNTAVREQTGDYSVRLTEAKRATVTEFYHPGFDHYFITSYPEEAASLAAGNLPPWVATGKTFNVWGSAGTFIDNVWRFFSASFAPQSGHFYTNNPDEAASLQMGNVWQLEAADAFYMMPSPDGRCEDGTRPLYRVYNSGMGGSPNHRYTIDPEVRTQMLAQGWISEGNGPDGVFTCVPF